MQAKRAWVWVLLSACVVGWAGCGPTKLPEGPPPEYEPPRPPPPPPSAPPAGSGAAPKGSGSPLPDPDDIPIP